MENEKIKETFSTNLKRYMIQYELNNVELSKVLGVSESTVGKWLLKKSIPRMGIIEQLSLLFHVEKSDLLEEKTSKSTHISGISNIVPIAKKKIPLIGTIAAGEPITADEHIEMLLPCDDDLHADFALRVQGDSMIGAGIYDGDIVFIRQQPDVDNGQIAAVLVDDSATLKHVYKTPDSCTLVSENPKYPPMVFTADNCDTLRILGLAVAKYSRIKQ